jgi:hypothetical protein
MMNTQHIDALSLTYNTDRTPLKLSEYGRHIQSMVDHVLTLEDRALRTHAAHAVVDAIAQLQPSIKEYPDWQHKLWDHVFSLSDYTLDVDAPFPAPLPEGRTTKPEPIAYPVKSTAHRYYGNILREMIQKALNLPEGEERDALIFDIANQMKRSYLTWNKDYVDDTVIFKELKTLSGGEIAVENVALTIQHGIAIKYAPLHTKTKKTAKKGFFKTRTGTPPSSGQGGGFKPYNRKK